MCKVEQLYDNACIAAGTLDDPRVLMSRLNKASAADHWETLHSNLTIQVHPKLWKRMLTWNLVLRSWRCLSTRVLAMIMLDPKWSSIPLFLGNAIASWVSIHSFQPESLVMVLWGKRWVSNKWYSWISWVLEGLILELSGSDKMKLQQEVECLWQSYHIVFKRLPGGRSKSWGVNWAENQLLFVY